MAKGTQALSKVIITYITNPFSKDVGLFVFSPLANFSLNKDASVYLWEEEGVLCHEPGLPPAQGYRCPLCVWHCSSQPHPELPLHLGVSRTPVGRRALSSLLSGVCACALKPPMSALSTSSSSEWAPFHLKTKIPNSVFFNFH